MNNTVYNVKVQGPTEKYKNMFHTVLMNFTGAQLPINIVMEYFKEIDLPSWPAVQEFCRSKWDGAFTTAKVFSGQDLDHIGKLVQQDILAVLGIKVKVKTAIMFINDANFVQDLHVDGFDPERVNASNTALNLPILNCENGPMSWYEGDFFLTKSPFKTIKYLKINWKTDPVLAVTKIINKPTFVKINIPHHIENQSASPRLMLSIRFTKDILLENIPSIS